MKNLFTKGIMISCAFILVSSLAAAAPSSMPLLKEAQSAFESGQYQRAEQLFRQAAARGSAEAQNGLGRMYALGTGMAKNYGEALQWFHKAADQANAEAQLNIGFIYVKGWGVTRNYREAVKWFRLAAEQKNAAAQSNLGVMYAKGWGVPVDKVEAYKWYLLSSRQGYEPARKNMSDLYPQMTKSQIALAQKRAASLYTADSAAVERAAQPTEAD